MMAAVFYGTLTLTLIGFAIALLLGRTSRQLYTDDDTIVDAINARLPQTQCAQCGYPGCRPYAEAVAAGEAINRCPPGGEATVRELAELLGRPAEPISPDAISPMADPLAVIREAECIGCTLCIQACPVDAIVGAPHMMHTVIAAECTGCELCIAPCPVDCIDLVERAGPEPIAPPASGTFNCIRCGECETVCPRRLTPQELLWYRESHARLEALRIDDCIECRLCDRACPSGIPLTAVFKAQKQTMHAERTARQKASHAQARYARHVERIAAQDRKVRRRPSAEETLALIADVKTRNG